MKRSLLFPNLLILAVFLILPGLFAAEVDPFSEDLPFVPAKPRCYIYRVAPADGDGDGQEDAVGTFCDMKVLLATNVPAAADADLSDFAFLRGYVDKLRQEGWDVVLVNAGESFTDGAGNDDAIRRRVLDQVRDAIARYIFPTDIANVLSHLGSDLHAHGPDSYIENLAEITITREGDGFRTGMVFKNYNLLKTVPPSRTPFEEPRAATDNPEYGE